MSPHAGGTHLEWGVDRGSGDEGSLPIFFGWEFILFNKTHFYERALTLHFMEEHSSPSSIFPVFTMTSSNGNMFRVTGFCAGNSPVTAGNSPVSEALMLSLICAWTKGWVNNQDADDLRRHRAHYDVTVMWCRIVIQWSGQPWDLSAFKPSNGNMFRVTGFCAGNSPVTAGNSPVSEALMLSLICAWTKGWVNNQDADDLRRHCAHYDVTVMWCRIVIQWSGQPWDLSAFNASLLSNFELVKRVKLGGSVHYGRNGLKFGTLLYHDCHSLKLTIFCTQRQFKFVVSDHPLVLSCAYYQYHPQCLLYSRDGRKRRRSYTYHTWQQSYSLKAYLSAGDRLCVCQKLPARNMATIVINACNHRQCWKSKWCNHRQGHIFLLPLLHRMGIK